MKLLILGGTGLVGRQLVAQALAHRDVSQVTAPTRRALAQHPQLRNPIVEYADLPPDADWWQADAVLCALGTTIRIAGSQAAFSRVDHDYVLAAARLAKASGTPRFVYNSALGANANARSFYLRVKGQVENDLHALNFPALTIVRPSLLYGGSRADKRPAETAAIIVSHLLGPLIPLRYRAVNVTDVAAAMINAAVTFDDGFHILESDQLQHADTRIENRR
ncbi:MULTISPECIES: oxidoreductase [unclassified Undibacterium]|uniref:oxidoreductase n=1 Tax=unclassified Undibacterium TaxID=2630295 RepID=UPI003C2EB313